MPASASAITTVPQRGMQVAHVDLNLIRNAYQFRLFLETQATAMHLAEAAEHQAQQINSATSRINEIAT